MATLADVLTSEDPPITKFFEIRKQVFTASESRRDLDGLVRNFKTAVEKNLSSENKAEVRRGVLLWLSGEVEKAIEVFKNTRTSKERDFFYGMCLLDQERPVEAYQLLKSAYESDKEDFYVAYYLGFAQVKIGNYDDAQKLIERLQKKFENNAEVAFLQGLLYDYQGLHPEAIEAYEKALELEPDHQHALFRLAYKYDLLGQEEQAMELYDQLRRLRPLHVNTMMNLGIIYEDRGEYNKALECYQAVLEFYPTHWKAKMYLRDAQASLKMFYDEEALKKEERRRQLSSQHVSELNLSTRAKNALQKAKIFTLADLVGRTEEELLELPGLGASALKEIKELLHSKGLGLSSHKEVSVDEYLKTIKPEVLNKPLSDFEWSGRIRKLFDKLGFITVGDLLRNTERDLLKNRNFGQTSLKEMRQKLATLGVQLRPG